MLEERAVEGTKGDVTVVIACFNYGRFLGEAVQSALSQSGARPHVVVVDDGSSEDETQAALAALPHEVELVRQANRGVCLARNAGLARVETPFAVVLDADDRLAPGALATMRSALDAHPDAGFAYGAMSFFGEWNGVLRFPAYDAYRLLYRHTIGLTALARTEVFHDTGGFDPGFEQYEDWELWLHALAHGWQGVQVEAVTLEYRRHGGTKLMRDRRHYRETFRRLQRKHAAVYARRRELAAASGMSRLERLVHRLYWGPRPVPALVEAALYRARWRRTSADV